MRKILSLLLAVIMICSTSVFGAVQTTTIVMQVDNAYMTVNDSSVSIDENGTVPVIVEGRTLVPIRAIIEALGGEVLWNADTRQTTLTHGDDTIVLTIDSTGAYINDTEYELDTAPVIINGRTMLPIRFIAEGFGFNVEWNGTDRTITIIKSEDVPEATEEPQQEETAPEDTQQEDIQQEDNTEETIQDENVEIQ